MTGKRMERTMRAAGWLSRAVRLKPHTARSGWKHGEGAGHRTARRWQEMSAMMQEFLASRM